MESRAKDSGRETETSKTQTNDVLFGMMFCADCGAKLYQVQGKRITKHLEYFVCATYRKEKEMCTSHRIRNQVVEQLLLEELKRITSFAKIMRNNLYKLYLINLNKIYHKNNEKMNEHVKKLRRE